MLNTSVSRMKVQDRIKITCSENLNFVCLIGCKIEITDLVLSLLVGII